MRSDLNSCSSRLSANPILSLIITALFHNNLEVGFQAFCKFMNNFNGLPLHSTEETIAADGKKKLKCEFLANRLFRKL